MNDIISIHRKGKGFHKVMFEGTCVLLRRIRGDGKHTMVLEEIAYEGT